MLNFDGLSISNGVTELQSQPKPCLFPAKMVQDGVRKRSPESEMMNRKPWTDLTVYDFQSKFNKSLK